VVLTTNGDGFRVAAVLDNHSLRVKTGYFVNCGYRRQQETFAALKHLGVRQDHVITLGYPDRGTEDLWTTNWNVPYVSPFTKDDHSPYTNSFTPHAAYTGAQLLSDMKKVLKQLNPDDVYIPHPNDQHPDHWATGAFVTTALYDLGRLDKTKVALYLVHRGDWPVPQGLHMDANLVPPAKLADTDTDWGQLPLDSATIQAKGLAAKEFRSQTGGTQRFLRSFVRRSELFGTRELKTPLVECPPMRIDGKTDDWEGIDPVITDPSDDGMPTHSRPNADLTGVYAARDSKRLYFRISVRGKISRDTIYELRVHPLGGEECTTVIPFRPGQQGPESWKVAFGRRDIEASCPLDTWKEKPLFIVVGTRTRWYRLGWYPVNRTASRILMPR
jgi:LmbE family N-acetylglucosaminyl deacetylase